MVNISQRPPEVEDRAVPGDWEGDLILGSIESAPRSAPWSNARPDSSCCCTSAGHTAEAVQQAMVAKMSRLPEQLRRTLTWDQGPKWPTTSRSPKTPA